MLIYLSFHLFRGHLFYTRNKCRRCGVRIRIDEIRNINSRINWLLMHKPSSISFFSLYIISIVTYVNDLIISASILFSFPFLGECIDILAMASNKIDVDKLNRSQTQFIDTPNYRKRKTKCINFETNIANCIPNNRII